MKSLRDRRAKAKIEVRIRRLSLGNPGDVKPVGEGVSELCIREGKGYRIYYVSRGDVLIILLCGGDKSSQQVDIKAAKALAIKSWSRSMSIKTTQYETADYLDSPDAIEAYLEAAFETNDTALITAALGDVAKANSTKKIADQSGLSWESLYRALSANGKPKLDTIFKVLTSTFFFDKHLFLRVFPYFLSTIFRCIFCWFRQPHSIQ